MTKKRLTKKVLEDILDTFAERTWQEATFFPCKDATFERFEHQLRLFGYTLDIPGPYTLRIYKGKKGIKRAPEEVQEYMRKNSLNYLVYVKTTNGVNPSFTDQIDTYKNDINNVLEGFRIKGINFYPFDYSLIVH